MHFPITDLSGSLDHGSDARVVVILSNSFPSFPPDLCLLKCALRNCRWIIPCVPVEAGIRGLSGNSRVVKTGAASQAPLLIRTIAEPWHLCLKTCWSRLGQAQRRYRRAKQTQDCSLLIFCQQQYLSPLHGHLGRVLIHMPVHLCAEQGGVVIHHSPLSHASHNKAVIKLPSACISSCLKALRPATPSPPQFISSFLCKWVWSSAFNLFLVCGEVKALLQLSTGTHL